MYKVSEDYSKNIAKAVRTTAISGFIKTKDGEVLTINDGSVKSGSLSISSRLNSSGDFKPGGVYSSELSATFLGISADELDGARITLNFLLYRGDSEEYDSVPLGTFYVDGSTIKRKGSAVSFKADDGLMNFDYPAEEISGSLHELAVTACIKCDIPLRTTTEEFAALPNAALTASVDTSRIQTWRDLLIFIAILTGTFVRIERTGGLSFVPLRCERDSGGMIIPVREIAGDIRSSTEFSDDTVRITKLFSRRGGGIISAERNFSESSEKYAALELMENPLLAELSDSDAQTALKNTLVPLSDCLNRAYKTDFNGDPALETGDYVRLRGGSIDTKRGYGTGMITSQVWRYHGKHTIQCSLSTSIPPEVGAQTFALRAVSNALEDTSKMRVQPKSQIEKRIDALEGAGGSGGVGKAAENYPTSEYFNDYENNIVIGSYNHVEGKENTANGCNITHIGGIGNTATGSSVVYVEGSGNTALQCYIAHVEGSENIAQAAQMGTFVGGSNNTAKPITTTSIIHGVRNVAKAFSSLITGNGNNVSVADSSIICGFGNDVTFTANYSVVSGLSNKMSECNYSLVLGSNNNISQISGTIVAGSNNKGIGNNGVAVPNGAVFGKDNMISAPYSIVFAFGLGLKVQETAQEKVVVTFGKYNVDTKYAGSNHVIFTIGNGTSDDARSNCFMIDGEGNVYCNKLYQTGNSNVASAVASQTSTASAQAARAITSAASAGIPIILLDHAPTAEDLTGSECVFLQCEDTAEVEGETTGIFRVTDIFAEK